MAKTLKTIEAFGIVVDGGDGGGRTTIYPTMEELKKEEFFDYIDEDSDQEDIDEAEEKFQSALNGDNPYEDGEISSELIQIEIDDETGEVTLAKQLSFSWGQ